MNPLLLIRIVRYLLRLLLVLLGIGAVMNGWGLCHEPESAEIGVLMIAAGILLPCAEGVFCLLNKVEKKIS